MYKIVLFFTALLFSISANAASLSVNPVAPSLYNITNNNTDAVTAVGTYTNFTRGFLSINMTSDVDALYRFDYNFGANYDFTIANPGSVTFLRPGTGTPIETLAIVPNLSFTRMLFAGERVVLTTNPRSGTSFTLGLTALPSEVPVPAALLLFAPALLGFLGLRRKAAKNANMVETA